MYKKILFLLLLGVLVACTPNNQDSETLPQDAQGDGTTAVSQPSLDGTAWELELLNGEPLIPNSRVTLSFNDENAGGFGGCNEYGGSYSAREDGRFSMNEFAITEALCGEPEGVNEQEQAYITALAQVDRYEFLNERLLLVNTAEQINLTFTPQTQLELSAEELAGTAWQLVSWSDRDIIPNSGITLHFDDAQTVSGFAGCRDYEGEFVVENNTFFVPSLGMTDVTCDAPEEVLRQEGDFTTALTETRRYVLEENRLTLLTNPGQELVFEPLADEEPTPEPTSEQSLITPVPTAVPTTEASFQSPIAFGDGFQIGRGEIVDAYFMADGSGLVTLWASGISYTTLPDVVERWYQPMPIVTLALDVRADEAEAAVALSNGEMALVDLGDGRFTTHPVMERSIFLADLAYAPDGSQIAFQAIGANTGYPIFLFNTADGSIEEAPLSQGNVGTLPNLVWSPAGDAILLASLEETCSHVIGLDDGERLFKLAHEEGCYASYGMTWSPDGRFLALPRDGAVDLLNFDTQTIERTFRGNVLSFSIDNAGTPLAFSDDGQLLLSKGGLTFYNEDFPTTIWDVATGAVVAQTNNEPPHQRLVSRIVGESVLSISSNGAISRWPFVEGEEEEQLGNLPVHVVRYPIIWSPDGRYIAAPSEGTHVIWNVERGGVEEVFGWTFNVVAFSPNGHEVALLMPDSQELILYNLENDEIKHTFANVTSVAFGVSFSPDGSLLVFGRNNEAIIARVTTGEEEITLTGYPDGHHISRVIWSPTGGAVTITSSPPDGDFGGQVVVWQEVAQGEYQPVAEAVNVRAGYTVETVPIARFNPSGTRVALENLPENSAGFFTIIVYDLELNEEILRFDGYALKEWQTDDLLIASEEQFNVRLAQWDVTTGEFVTGNATDNNSLHFAPEGGFFATVGGALFVKAVQLRFWQSSLVLAQADLPSDILQISWSPNGRFIAASDQDGRLTVWPIIYNE